MMQRGHAATCTMRPNHDGCRRISTWLTAAPLRGCLIGIIESRLQNDGARTRVPTIEARSFMPAHGSGPRRCGCARTLKAARKVGGDESRRSTTDARSLEATEELLTCTG